MLSRLERNVCQLQQHNMSHHRASPNAAAEAGLNSLPVYHHHQEQPLQLQQQLLLQQQMINRNFNTRNNPDPQDSPTDEVVEATRNANNGGERVTLKMDVSFSDHSFIIGRGGKGIQGVMRETGCHIHFPDSNRNQRSEKSNQVSVAGPPAGVITARQRIREHLPISLAFMVDSEDYKRAVEKSPTTKRLEPKHKIKQMIETLQNEHRMTITWLPMENFSCAMVTVRGRRSNFQRIRTGLTRLTSFLRPGQPPPIVHLGIEVSPHHFNFILSMGDDKIRDLMASTNTKFVMAPMRSDLSHHIPTIRIFGEVDNVYDAWIEFMDLLPAVLHIDVPDTIGWRGRDYAEYPDDLIEPWGSRLEQLQGLRDLGVLSPEMMAAAIAASDYEGTIGFLQPVSRSLISLTAQLNSFLNDHHIMLMLRLGRDSRHWKIVAKGPEKYVGFLVDIYRAIKDTSRNPVIVIRKKLEALLKRQNGNNVSAPSPPLPLPQPSLPLPPPSLPPPPPLPSPNFTLLSSMMGATLSPNLVIPASNDSADTMPLSLPPWLGDSGCLPCRVFGYDEAYAIFDKLLKLTRELRFEGNRYGYYTIEPHPEPPANNPRQWTANGMSQFYPSTPFFVNRAPENQYGGVQSVPPYVNPVNSNNINNNCVNPGVDVVNVNTPPQSCPECVLAASRGGQTDFYPWSGQQPTQVMDPDCYVSQAGPQPAFYENDINRNILMPPSYAEVTYNQRLEDDHHNSTMAAAASSLPIHQNSSAVLDGFPVDGQGDGGNSPPKTFDLAPGAGRDHRRLRSK